MSLIERLVGGVEDFRGSSTMNDRWNTSYYLAKLVDNNLDAIISALSVKEGLEVLAKRGDGFVKIYGPQPGDPGFVIHLDEYTVLKPQPTLSAAVSAAVEGVKKQ